MKGYHQTPDVDRRSRCADVWRAIRIMRQFTIAEIVAAVECNEATVRSYLWRLNAAGYTQRTAVKIHGPRRIYHYRLIRDTGPHNPRFNKRCDRVWDPNTGEEQILPRRGR